MTQEAELNLAKVSVQAAADEENADSPVLNDDGKSEKLKVENMGSSMANMGSLSSIQQAMEKNDVLVLPDNIYTAAIILPMTRDPTEYGIITFWKNLQFFLLVSSNIVAQSFLIGFISDIYNKQEKGGGKCGTDERQGDNPTDPKLRAIAQAIFIGYCMIDFLETWNMTLWWLDMSRAIPQKCWDWLNWVLNFLTCYCCGFGITRKTRFCNRDGEEDDISKEFADRIQGCHILRKMWVHFILLLKYALNISLVVYGTGFLLLSETNADLILNALALTFVLELDEMFYQFFLTTEMKVMVETFTPMVVIQEDSGTQLILSNLTILARAGILGGATLLMYSFYCTDLWEEGKFNRNG